MCTLTFSMQSITIADEQDEAFDGGDTYAIQNEDYSVWVKDVEQELFRRTYRFQPRE